MTTKRQENELLFNGRERIVRDIVQGLLAEAPGSFSLVGSKMVGKSRLLQFLASEEGPLLGDAFALWRPAPFQDPGRLVVVHVDSSLPDAQANFMAYLVRQVADAIQREHLLPQGAAADESHPLQLMALLQRLNQRGYRPVLLLDSFDRVFAALPMDTVNELRPLTRLASVVVATEQPLIDLDRDRSSSPLFNMMAVIFIGLLEPDAARRWMEGYATLHPGMRPCLDELLEITGTHPYLLRRMGDILQEVECMLPRTVEVGPAHLPLLRLRLAEHSRPLFEVLWRRLQAPPAPLKKPVVLSLIQRLVEGPLPLAALGPEESSTINWIFNLALIACCGVRSGRARSDIAPHDGAIGYEFFSPLLTDFLRERLSEPQREPVANGAMRSTAATPSAAPQGNGAAARKATTQPGKPPAPVNIAPEFLERLTKIEVALLGYFQSHSYQIVSPEQLLRDVWRRPDATARRVQEAIRRLRMVLDEADPPIGAIENDRGRGYRFVPAKSN